ncbi:uncharacterized protein B0J16DRAFT_393922 [Fusarium flagelliforme]|uniref:Uncharacterized protein n=1 Tax=Fusarium flagelliforme TaxID=2675880 RepID=A0A395MCC0_9HYPO|nr:uncharacterized protein B0J16DRAFT_393922 [Fusarium flagelliforme]KAH7191859.1 hypothetical protein B0J16DRAFT_393922 [Fusarium flagelliforme]RFN45518.1 hypothetical protein FIE12Z_10281 [Fusarium flagelliforme]
MADRDDSDHDMTPHPELEAKPGQDSDHEAEPEQNAGSDPDTHIFLPVQKKNQPPMSKKLRDPSNRRILLLVPNRTWNRKIETSNARAKDASPQPENAGSEASSPYPEDANPDRDYPEDVLSRITSPSNDLPQYAPPQNAPPPYTLALDGYPDAPPMDPGPLILSDSDDSSPPPEIPIDPDLPIATIEEPDEDSSRRSSVQTDSSFIFDGSDPARDTTVASTAPPQSPTPRPMPPVRPFRDILPRPPGMPHNPQIPGPAPIAPMHSYSTPSGGPTNGHQQRHPQGNNVPNNGESSTNAQRQQQPPYHNNRPQHGTALPNSQNQPRGDNARQNEENGGLVHVTPRRHELDVGRLSRIMEEYIEEDGSLSNYTTSPPSQVHPPQTPAEGSSNGLPENHGQENNAHQNGAVPPDMPIDPSVSELPPAQQQPPHTNGHQPPRSNGQHNRTAPRERRSRFVETGLLEGSQTEGSVVNGAPPNSAAPSGPTSASVEKDSEEEL